MFGNDGKAFFEGVLQEALGLKCTILGSTFESGGCINNAVKLSTSEGVYFLKWNGDIPDDMFQKEGDGLKLLADCNAIKIPELLGYGKFEGKYFLLLEYIESDRPSQNYWEDFGSQLAKMHLENTIENYGLSYDNYIGKLPQANDPLVDWVEFFIQNRLEPQLKLAIYNGLVSADFVTRYREFYQLLPELLPVDQPALLHGDMWSGNVMVGSHGKACLIDPAVYYGHREIELAFTRMFGGFDRSFYDAYQESYPLEPGFEERVGIYNIYPHMVHVNLFGTSYLNGVESILRHYL